MITEASVNLEFVTSCRRVISIAHILHGGVSTSLPHHLRQLQQGRLLRIKASHCFPHIARESICETVRTMSGWG
jgi:hypothetical protein